MPMDDFNQEFLINNNRIRMVQNLAKLGVCVFWKEKHQVLSFKFLKEWLQKAEANSRIQYELYKANSICLFYSPLPLVPGT